jgi:hypothetical protein
MGSLLFVIRCHWWCWEASQTRRMKQERVVGSTLVLALVYRSPTGSQRNGDSEDSCRKDPLKASLVLMMVSVVLRLMH